MEIKTQPNALQSEQALLGGLLITQDYFLDILEIVRDKNNFYVPKHRVIFEIMHELFIEGNPIDHINVANALQNKGLLESIGGNVYLSELTAQTPAAPALKSYAETILEKALRRKLIDAGGKIIVQGELEGQKIETSIDEAEKALYSVTEHIQGEGYIEIADEIPKIVEQIIQLAEGTKKQRGVPTGFDSITKKLSGFQPSDLIILAARPSMGKTTLALDIARKIAIHESIPVAMFSLEMSATQLIERLIATESQIDAWKMRTGQIKNTETMSLLTEAADRLSRAPLYIDDKPGNSILNIRTTARRMKREQGIQLIIVDYLQLISPHETKKSDSMVQQVTEISRTLKQIARELNVPLIALSQLSRDIEKRQGRPRLSDLRDSGSIEQDADVVMFIHQDEKYEGNDDAPIAVKLLIEKHRNGPTGSVALQFDRRRVTFVEPASSQYEQIAESSQIDE
ncbi:MAG: replicative DNA helicase [Alphaproteobacteria bacterium]|nr:replicative DNA helicase [Alphaproteobacteria bacterium]